jgi:Flp pilus assembly protein TadG
MSTAFRSRSQEGAVTAEAAVVLPVLALVALLMSWVVSIGLAQVRVVDAARETARAAARAESPGEAVALGRRVAPDGAQVTVRQGPDAVVARVASDVRGPGGVFGFLGPVRVSAEAVAAPEPTP